MPTYVIRSPSNAHVLDASFKDIARFDTRAAARKYRDEILPSIPSKDCPLRVVLEH